MELSSILIALVFMLGATAICVILFQHLIFFISYLILIFD